MSICLRKTVIFDGDRNSAFAPPLTIPTKRAMVSILFLGTQVLVLGVLSREEKFN
jgi:hypothetical protein